MASVFEDLVCAAAARDNINRRIVVRIDTSGIHPHVGRIVRILEPATDSCAWTPVTSVTLLSGRYGTKAGLCQNVSNLVAVVALNFEKAILHRASGPAGFLHLFG